MAVGFSSVSPKNYSVSERQGQAASNMAVNRIDRVQGEPAPVTGSRTACSAGRHCSTSSVDLALRGVVSRTSTKVIKRRDGSPASCTDQYDRTHRIRENQRDRGERKHSDHALVPQRMLKHVSPAPE
jgi:hypothetical protein